MDQTDKKLRDAVLDEAKDQAAGAVLQAFTGGTVPAPVFGIAKKLMKHIFMSGEAEVEAAADELLIELNARLQSTENFAYRQDILEEWLGDPERNRVLRLGFMEMLESTDPAAWPFIASLTADYWADRRPVDSFFKDAGRLFTSALNVDLNLVTLILKLLLIVRGTNYTNLHHIVINHNRPPTNNITVVEPDIEPFRSVSKGAYIQLDTEEQSSSFVRVGRLLSESGFAVFDGRQRITFYPHTWSRHDRLAKYMHIGATSQAV